MRALLTAVVFALGAAVTMAAAPKEYSHQKYFEHYEGTKTCLKCHQKSAEAFFHSQHYQWKGEAPGIVNAGGKRLGKMNTINDFCTGPAKNWIGETKNSRGDVLAQGCSKCHAGKGLLPSETLSPEQLENMDCLMCHAQGYQRGLFEDGKGGWEWRPVLWKNQEGLDSVSKRIGMPTRNTCLRCHAGSGGGPNYKRGDLEYALADCDRDFDVHMAKEGSNLQCVDCHAGADHRVRGRGSDLSGSDMPSKPLSCDSSECHGAAPHASRVLNAHAARVYCATCHIPKFAKTDPTDMARDWSKPSYSEEKDRYAATIALEKNVTPVYAWFNGMTKALLPGEPAEKRPDGTVGMMTPVGSRGDAKARIFPFKLHRGRMPVLDGKNYLLPIEVESFFASGKLHEAILGATEEAYGVKDAHYRWEDTVRYMGIFHEVVPAKRALACLDCHDTGKRLDWKGLGYTGDPLLLRIAQPAPTAQKGSEK